MTAREVAAALRVGISTVSRMAKTGRLTPIVLGKPLRFRRSDVEALLQPADRQERAS